MSDSKFVLNLLLNQMVKMLEQALELAGKKTLSDFADQMDQMNAEQSVEFLTRQAENPYTPLLKHITQLEKEYASYRDSPEAMERAIKKVSEITGMDEKEVKKIAMRNKDDDDTTKH